MSDETFRLTQLADRSRFTLPSLNSPAFSLRRSENSAEPSEVGTSKLRKSSSTFARVSDKLGQVQLEVKRSFETLYTSRRNKLLPKAMELERSESVKDQLKALETHVVSLLKTYNELQNQRRAKEGLVSSLSKELENVLGREPDLTPVKSTALDVQRRYEIAMRQFERETDYEEMLDHMIVDRSKAISARVQPIYSLRKELQQLKLRFHESEVDYLRVSLDSRSQWNTIKRKEESLAQQKAHNKQRISDKMLHFRRRVEFVEFVTRQDGQKSLESQIQENEKDEGRMQRAKANAERIEHMLEDSKTQLDALHEYERHSEKLARAAHTGNIQQVIDYWAYLQDFESSLSKRAEACTSRISELRTQFKALSEERTSVRLSLDSDSPVTETELRKLQAVLERKEKDLEERVTKVGSRQLAIWRQATASVRGRLEGIWMMLGETIEEMSLMELLGRMEQLLVERISTAGEKAAD